MFFEGPKGVNGSWVETIAFGEGEWPEPEEWFPAREEKEGEGKGDTIGKVQ